MARVYQQSLFSWKDVEDLGDLERLKLVVESMPDQKLIEVLYQKRGRGRKDHPVEALWNSLLAGVVFQHKSIESLRRELKRNAQLRELCGFNVVKGAEAVPSKSAYTRFLKNLLLNEALIDEIFNALVSALEKLLPGFGTNLAGDSKAIHSAAKKTARQEGDQRGEQDADFGKKTYRGTKEDGTPWVKVRSWFGFKLHLVVDADYELPVAMSVTKASVSDVSEMKPLMAKLAQEHSSIVRGCEHFMGDKGYDSTELISWLWKEHEIKAVIDIRNMWQDGDRTRNLPSGRYGNMTYDHRGGIFCHCPKTNEVKPMVHGGFDKKREALKYSCPMMAKGVECKGACNCPLRGGVRIKLAEDRRVFTAVARSSYKWKNLYDKRTSVERVNSRVATSFGLEKHYIRGLAKMKMRCSLALCVMLAVAVGRIEQGQQEKMRSLVQAA